MLRSTSFFRLEPEQSPGQCRRRQPEQRFLPLLGEVKLELESALGSTKSGVFHNLCKALDRASLECKIVLCLCRGIFSVETWQNEVPLYISFHLGPES